jgi:hypothetical protein
MMTQMISRNSNGSHIPEGYAPTAQAGQPFDLSDNAVRLLARRRQIGAVLIRGRLYVSTADLARLHEPQPYPPPRAA